MWNTSVKYLYDICRSGFEMIVKVSGRSIRCLVSSRPNLSHNVTHVLLPLGNLQFLFDISFPSDFYNLISLLEGIDTWQGILERWSTLKSSSACDGEPTTAKRTKKGVSFRVSCRCRQKAARLFDVKVCISSHYTSKGRMLEKGFSCCSLVLNIICMHKIQSCVFIYYIIPFASLFWTCHNTTF